FLHGPLARGRFGAPRELERQHRVFQRRERRQELERLENEAHHLAAQARAPVLVEGEEVLTRDPGLPRGRNVEAGEQSQQCGLPGARGPEDRQRLPREHLESRVAHDGELVVGRGDLFGERLGLHNDGLQVDRPVEIPRMHLAFRVHRLAVFALAALALAACGAQARTLMVFGDSLSAAYNLPVEKGWVQLVERKIRDAGLDWKVVNASVSGETTAGGLRRLPEDLKRHKPDVVLIELGANDALRGQPLPGIRSNLVEMIKLARKARAEPVIVGLMIPPNYGIDYAAEFQRLY